MDSKGDATTSHLFPDLHHKMSKKIAQLTRVIYQLHSRNQDGKDEMDAVTRKHEHALSSPMVYSPLSPFLCLSVRQRKDIKKKNGRDEGSLSDSLSHNKFEIKSWM